MKKVVWSLLAVILLGIVGFCVWYLTGLSSVSAERVLPAQPLLYVQFSDTRKHWGDFKQSSFGKKLSEVNLTPLMRGNPQLNVAAQGLKVLQEQLKKPDVQAYLDKFFGEQVTIAVYRNNPEETLLVADDRMKQLYDQALPEVFWVSRVTGDIKLKELFIRLSSKTSEDSGLKKVPYRGKIIYLWPMGETGLSIGFVRIGDVFVAGLGEQPARKAIDTYLKARAPLSNDDQFHAAVKSVWSKGAIMNLYWNSSEFLGLLSNVIHANQPRDNVVEKSLDHMQGFSSGTVAVSWEKTLNINNEMRFDPDLLSADLKMYVNSCKPDENGSLLFAPKDVLLYQWIGCLDFGYYWTKIQEEVRKNVKANPDAQGADPVASMERNLGLNIKTDIIEPLGGEIGWMANVGTQSLPILGLKIPQPLIFIKLKDQIKAEHLMKTLMAKVAKKVSMEIKNGRDIFYFETPLGGAVEPAYSFLKGYVVIGLNRDIIKEAIYAMSSKQGALVSDAALAPLIKDSSERANIGVFYFKLGELLERYSGLIDTGYQWAMAQQQSAEERAMQEAMQAPTSLDQTIDQMQTDITQGKLDLRNINDQIWDMTLKGEETAEKKKQAKDLETKLDALQTALQEAQENRLNEIQAHAPQPKIDQSPIVWRNVVAPSLDALKQIKTMVSVTVLEKDRFKTRASVEMER